MRQALYPKEHARCKSIANRNEEATANWKCEKRNEAKPSQAAPRRFAQRCAKPKESDAVSSQTEQNIARHFNKSELPNDDDDDDGDDTNFRLMLMLAKYPHRT